MIGTPPPVRRRLIAQHLASDHARERVATALYDAVVQGLEFGPRDLPRAEDQEWIRANMAIPLQDATDAALRTLVRSVSETLEQAPDGLLHRFEQSHYLEDLGIE